MRPDPFIIIALAAFLTSALTLFSGFGLGTLLMPVFAVFFPVETAIAMTAMVHLLNNIFKFFLLGRKADKVVVLRFGLPAILAAFLGAWVLIQCSDLAPLLRYSFLSRSFEILPVNLIVAVLMIFFVLFEVIPLLQNITFDKKFLPLGGALSGFFGGLSGHQGALRSAFLVKCGLAKESFIASNAVIACLVDISRISVYGVYFSTAGIENHKGLIVTAVLAAFAGAWTGNRLVKKVTLRTIQVLVSILLFVIALCLGSGLI